MPDQITLAVIGHVDYGKTALVRALMGIETDRSKEEKKHGLSIVLDFSYLAELVACLDVKQGRVRLACLSPARRDPGLDRAGETRREAS